MSKRHNDQINLQLWTTRDFKQKIEKTALAQGFPRWQSWAELLLFRAVQGDIELEMPKLVNSDSVGRRE